MKLSVIIPCYNVENFVQKCTESILIQKGFDFEIILVNDGSKDKTSEILRNLAKTDNRIRLVNQENKGLSGARNCGIEKASGEYLMFIDADDWLEPNAFKIISQNFQNQDLFCFSYNRIFETQVKSRKLNIEGNFDASFVQRRIIGLLNEELKDPSQADSLVTAWAKIYKSEIIKKNQIKFTDTKEIGTEDVLFNIHYLEHAKTVKVIDEPLYNYLKNNYDSLTKLYRPNLFVQWKNLYAKIFEIIRNKDLAYKNALDNRIALSIIGLAFNETFSNKTFSKKKKKISEILHDNLYQKAYQNLDFQYFPIHWKLFFHFAKSKYASGIVILSSIMNFLINKSKN